MEIANASVLPHCLLTSVFFNALDLDQHSLLIIYDHFIYLEMGPASSSISGVERSSSSEEFLLLEKTNASLEYLASQLLCDFTSLISLPLLQCPLNGICLILPNFPVA